MVGSRINSVGLVGGLCVLGLFAVSVRDEKRADASLGVWGNKSSFETVQLVPAKNLIGVGCCIDEIDDASWSNGHLILKSGNHNIDLRLSEERGGTVALPKKLQFDALTAVSYKRHVYVGETKHDRLLDLFPGGSLNALFGSAEVGGVYSVRLETKIKPFKFLLATGSRARSGEFLLESMPKDANGDKLYLRHSSIAGPALMESEGDRLNTLEVGEELYAPSGLVLSPKEDELFVADERQDELVWLRLTRNLGGPVDKQHNFGWKSKGRFARFPLQEGDRRIFRGLEVVVDSKQDDEWYLAGAGPRGIYFYDRNGRRLGEIETSLPVSYLRMSSEVNASGSKCMR